MPLFYVMRSQPPTHVFAACRHPGCYTVLQVGVAMSLYIVLDPLITSKQYKAHAVFFMAAMAFSTTIINGTTARYLLNALGLVDMTPQQLEVLEHVLKVRLYCLAG